MSDAIVEVQDRLLEKPMGYSVPVAGESNLRRRGLGRGGADQPCYFFAGAEKLVVHLTTFSGDVEIVHLRRFVTDIGRSSRFASSHFPLPSYSLSLTRSCSP